jgi:NitT/TauT family transport system substrate-binding protein
LFWFIARPGLNSLADLAGRRLAVHPAHTPPGCFARIVMRQAGLDPDRDVHCLPQPPGDYGMYLRQLRHGEIDAAYVGSTMAPEAIAAENGWRMLAWVGDHFLIPTVGVAVDPTYTQPDGPAVQAVVRAHRRALRLVRDDPDTTVRYMRTFLGQHTADEARAHYKTFIAPHYVTDAQADLSVGAAAISAVAAELGVPVTFTAADFYHTT